MKKTDIYKVTFGMQNDAKNNPIYISKVTIHPDKDSTIEIPVYAEMKGERLFELSTRTEIPTIYSKNIPGFGVYSITKIYTNDDYKELSYYLSIISGDHLEQYVESFYKEINRLSRIEEQFNSSHSDCFGKLSNQSNERDQYFQEKFHRHVLISEQRVKELSTGQLSLFKRPGTN